MIHASWIGTTVFKKNIYLHDALPLIPPAAKCAFIHILTDALKAEASLGAIPNYYRWTDIKRTAFIDKYFIISPSDKVALPVVLELYGEFYDFTKEETKYILAALCSMNAPYSFIAIIKDKVTTHLRGLKLKPKEDHASAAMVSLLSSSLNNVSLGACPALFSFASGGAAGPPPPASTVTIPGRARAGASSSSSSSSTAAMADDDFEMPDELK